MNRIELLRGLSVDFYNTIKALPEQTQKEMREKQEAVSKRRRSAEKRLDDRIV